MTLDDLWYKKHPFSILLIPLAWIFCIVVRIRRQAYKHNFFTRKHIPVPVIVVGNITVGGTGKTPLVSWLGRFLKQQGFKPGIISRGYKGNAKEWPQVVYPDSDPYLVGDEPVLLARQSNCPVVVSPNRFQAASVLYHDCDIIISDDGLQHYALFHDIRIAIVDATRRYGNQRCLPAGPLREPLNSLTEMDFIIVNGSQNKSENIMQYQVKPLCKVLDNQVLCDLTELRGQTVHAVAGIGNPDKFFSFLREKGLIIHQHPFPDHHHYQPKNIQFNDNLLVIMTEKDAVKCQTFANQQHLYLPIDIDINFSNQLLSLINLRVKNKKNIHEIR
ncbi:tetraacyldisaccharide 4'-kinase [Candidatus Halobeggiatoa sp. HSG11]|nr:tetraacyldisaccharide 4'-kinase [Candidatus Halobeggiatoa sp. HSG11]